MDYQNLYYFQCIQMKNGEFFELDRINARISFSLKLFKELNDYFPFYISCDMYTKKSAMA